MKSKLAVYAFVIIAIYIHFNRQQYHYSYLCYDPSGYYLYLPAAIIYHDLDKLAFYHDEYGLHHMPNGNRLNKYAIGTCLFQLPLFLIAHVYCKFDRTYPDTGYSRPFTIAHILSTLLWTAIGLFILRKFLKKRYDDNVVSLTILAIGFGTNLYSYAIFEPGMSHPYSFTAVAAILYFTDSWYDSGNKKYLYLLAFTVGIATVVRPINIIFAIIPMFWMVHNISSLTERLQLFMANWLRIGISFLIFCSVLTIQIAYWKYVTGHWIFYSYVGEYFNFRQPHIIEGLFSWRKGWFIYTPIAFFIVPGLIILWKNNRKIVPSLVLFLTIYIYVVFSWHMWFYGGSFGCRALIDALPVAAIGVAAVINYVLETRLKPVKAISLATLTLLIALNMFQTYQYVNNVISCDRMTWYYYKAVFCKTTIDNTTRENLLVDYSHYNDE